jgi:tRNA threonylcarbamoyladenosine biosynthesis protein TsaB
LLRALGLAPTQVNLVATTIGPGSFTGLRVGVTTAKTFAYAAHCDVLGLDTLDVVAQQAASELAGTRPGELHAVLDAGREELYLARYKPGEPIVRLEPNRIIPVSSWLASLPPQTLFAGAGVARLIDKLPAGAIMADPSCFEPQARAVGRMALAEYRRGRRDDLWKLAPAYLRASAAEEKAAQKAAASK